MARTTIIRIINMEVVTRHCVVKFRTLLYIEVDSNELRALFLRARLLSHNFDPDH